MKYFKLNKANRLKTWHVWFAWHPVTISSTKDGDYKRMWLENVLRCGTEGFDSGGFYWQWEYKELNNIKTVGG